MTLKERILLFKMEVQKKDGSAIETQVFKAIDQNKRGKGYIFTFHPDAKETAQEHIAGMYLFLQKDLTKEELAKYFAPEEIRRGQKLVWKAEGQRVASEDDQEIESIEALDEHMKIMDTWFQIVQPNSHSARVRFSAQTTIPLTMMKMMIQALETQWAHSMKTI
jgi:hypothetical protein